MATIKIRFYPLFLLLIPLFLPYVITAFMSPKSDLAKRVRKLLLISLPIFIGTALLVLIPQPGVIMTGRMVMGVNACADQDFTILESVPAGRIISPYGLSLTLLEQQKTHQVATNGFHRGAPGIKRIAETFMDVPPDIRKAALKPFDYVVICKPKPKTEVDRSDAPLTEPDLSDAPLYAALVSGQVWDGLIDITPTDDSRLRLYKIDHAKLP